MEMPSDGCVYHDHVGEGGRPDRTGRLNLAAWWLRRSPGHGWRLRGAVVTPRRVWRFRVDRRLEATRELLEVFEAALVPVDGRREMRTAVGG